MLELYHVGVNFFNTLFNIGNWLVDYKVSDLVDYAFQNPNNNVFDEIFLNNLDLLIGDYTVCSLVLGGGVLFFLVFKIVKFFTDIIL